MSDRKKNGDTRHMTKAILFDLDGTLTDSGEGITKCAQYAFQKLNLKSPSLDDLRIFVGPPLARSFAQKGVPKEKIDTAITYFRERYQTIGKYENIPYHGIKELLAQLKNEGYQLFTATSKPEILAKEILSHFELDSYFVAICGASLDHSRETKEAVIAYLLKKYPIQNAIMIGDTSFDVYGAAKFNIPCIGVDWGYGNCSDMKKAGAITTVSSIDELYNNLHHFF